MSAISGWTVVITPKFNTSKMLVTVNISVECRSANMIGVELTRNGTAMFNNKGGFRGYVHNQACQSFKPFLVK